MTHGWRRVTATDVAEVVSALERWPCAVGGYVRHMFGLATIEAVGADSVRVTGAGDTWAACVVLGDNVIVPCGHAASIAAAGVPTRRWRLVVGDAAAADALLSRWGPDGSLRVHVQRFQTIDPERVPDEAALPEPGLRLARPSDVPQLARLAVLLHIEDGYGPHPGRSGERGYRVRIRESVDRGTVYCVGPIGRPLIKVERSVSSKRYGVQLSGICAEPHERGRGLGRAAVAAAVRAAMREGGLRRPISLHVRAGNDAALRAYAAAGFVDREEWRMAVRS